MKKIIIAVGFLLGNIFPLFAQEPSIKIILNEQERFRFDSIRMEMINSSHHTIIGDSAGMNNQGNSVTHYNTFIGFKAGRIIESGDYNTFIGSEAGEHHKNGIYNVYLGGWAGKFDSIGRMNTFLGTDVGVYNKTGQKNTYVGYASGAFGDSCSFNTNMGYWSGGETRGGMENVFVGFEAGRTTGRHGAAYHNTYLGAGAGRNNEYGNDNVFIGYHAGMNDTTSWNRLVIANNDSTRLIVGQFDIPMIKFNAKWIVPGLGNNISLGDSAGATHQTGPRNTWVGHRAGIYDSAGSYNVFIGCETGRVNTTGRLNCFVGTNAGFYNSSGIENTYLGTSAGGSNTIGNFNTCLGRRAGLYNETGSGNVFVGYYAGANEPGSNKLYVANSDTIAPLIYGEFDQEVLKVHGEIWAVDHDVYVTESSKGIILTSPSGYCFRVKVDDLGNLTAESVACP